MIGAIIFLEDHKLGRTALSVSEREMIAPTSASAVFPMLIYYKLLYQNLHFFAKYAIIKRLKAFYNQNAQYSMFITGSKISKGGSRMEDRKKMKELESSFKALRVEREMALNIALAKLENVAKSCGKVNDGYNMFSTIQHRIKTFDSTVEKCTRRGYELSIDSICKNVLDIAGIRIITPFRDDVYSVVDILHHIPGVFTLEEKDYIASPKENGYASYHMQIQLEVFEINNGTKLVPVEVQIRDKAMDLWATTEHIVKYKNSVASPDAVKHYKRIAELLTKVDELAIELRDFGRVDSLL